jgi:hypothetical protein
MNVLHRDLLVSARSLGLHGLGVPSSAHSSAAGKAARPPMRLTELIAALLERASAALEHPQVTRLKEAARYVRYCFGSWRSFF